MDIFLKPTNKAGFYVDADGNNYVMDGDWFIPLYPHQIHKTKVTILSMNGGTHNTPKLTRVQKKKSDSNNISRYVEPVNACDLSGG